MNTQEREQHALKLHQESEEFRAEAKQILAECRETLAKTQRFNDQAMINQRSLVFALNSLLPRPIRFSVNFSLSEDEFTAKLEKDTATAISKREAFDIVHAINVLAMANTDILNINTQFRGCSNLFIVRVRPLSVASPDGDEYSLSPVVYREEVSLVDGFYVGCPTGDCPIQRLLRIESEITELIIEAREEAEAKAEVTA
ncbi:hypothetical protein H4F04_11130 [Vibrio scophthalmi]|uniref:hypothetical protein n=1 Tax=Vibrio TaxID=662 RepID=UPI002FEECA06